MFLCCWRICEVRLALELVGPWVVLGFSVGMEAFNKLLSINVPGVRSSLVFSGLDLSLLPLVFSLIFTVTSRLLHLYGTIDKTSRLKMKSFSTVRDIQRGSQSYMEKRRGRRKIEVTRRRRGGIKKGENKLASYYSLMCSPQSGLLRDVHRVIQRREKREEEDRGGQEDKGGNQKERDRSSQ